MHNINMVLSYLTLRRSIGFIGILFPFLILVGSWFSNVEPEPMRNSISAYYWSGSNAIFVSGLVAVGLFLVSYKGYDKRDRIITTVAGIAMIMVALFPAFGESPENPVYLFGFLSPEVNTVIHYVAAITTFALMGHMSYFQFTKTNEIDKKYITVQKRKRNQVYRICGMIILVCAVLAPVVRFIPIVFVMTNSIRLFYWLEALMVVAFGFSWLVKGEALLSDSKKVFPKP